MIVNWLSSSEIQGNVFIPKYYDPRIANHIEDIKSEYIVLSIKELVDNNILEYTTGDEIGKESYGTGNIPFVRTSDISNWEIKSTPKQGISEEIFKEYADKQDVQDGDILIVRDGTYLIGTNCFVTFADAKILFQSHILKIRIKDKSFIPPEIFFVALNSPIVQRQIRSFQFTADIIDTIGSRFQEIKIPVIKDELKKQQIVIEIRAAMEERLRGKCFIKQAPLLIEESLISISTEAIENFHRLNQEDLKEILVHDTVTLEFGGFETTWQKSKNIKGLIYLPKYYDPEITKELDNLSGYCDIKSISELVNENVLAIQTGDEIGKMAYETGDIPFIRTSDFANWEIKHDPKQGVSEEIYQEYAAGQDLQELDILLVRDGTYLVGTSTIVLSEDVKSLYCGGLYRIRVSDKDYISPFLLLGLMNSYIMKRQIRARQFTRDVIDTLGKRLEEVYIPVPKDISFRKRLGSLIEGFIRQRYEARNLINNLAKSYASSNVIE